MKISKLLFKAVLNGCGLMFAFSALCELFQRELPETAMGMIALWLIALFVGFVIELASVQELIYKEVNNDR